VNLVERGKAICRTRDVTITATKTRKGHLKTCPEFHSLICNSNMRPNVLSLPPLRGMKVLQASLALLDLRRPYCYYSRERKENLF
jgi:hypothetical protein